MQRKEYSVPVLLSRSTCSRAGPVSVALPGRKRTRPPPPAPRPTCHRHTPRGSWSCGSAPR
eukprot:scaffold24571_cov57-Phaeocystis_antarctica.AAC.2